MNDKIKELYRSSRSKESLASQDEYNSANVLLGSEVEKFAELIVRECIEVIVRNEHASLNISNFTDEKAQGIQLGLEFATIDIAEHFGVEE